MDIVDRRWILGGLLLGAGVGIALAAHARAVRRIKAGERVLLVGDSLAVGLGPPMRALASDDHVELQTDAISGTTFSAWAGNERLGAVLAAYRPDFVLISLGTNDAYSLGAHAETASKLVEHVRTVNPETSIVWIAPPKLPARSASGYPLRPSLLGDIDAVMREEGVTVFDSHHLDIPRGPDNLHPTAAGYAGWAGSIWDWIGP